MVATLLILGAILPAARTVGRVTIPFDLGWRFSLGAEPEGVADRKCDLYTSMPNGTKCSQIHDHGTGGWDLYKKGGCPLGQCRAAACARRASAWRWSDGNCELGQQRVEDLNCTVSGTDPVEGGTLTDPDAPWIPPASSKSFDDTGWDVVDAPHDYEITGNYSQSDEQNEAFLPHNQGFYRKHFGLPLSWKDTVVEFIAEGSLSVSSWWLNGQPLLLQHQCGYVSVILRLDNVKGAPLEFGPDSDNVLVAFIDAAETTGWWYEGAGLIRHNWLSSRSAVAHVATHGIWAPSSVTGQYHTNGSTANGVTNTLAAVWPSAAIYNGGMVPNQINVKFTLYNAEEQLVAMRNRTYTVNATGDGKPQKITSDPRDALQCTNCELWSVARPYLHTLVTEVMLATGPTAWEVIDSVNTTIGVRSVLWNSEDGLHVNDQHVKLHGFCNHESFAGVGAAIPDRVDLLRVQQMRGVGGTAGIHAPLGSLCCLALATSS